MTLFYLRWLLNFALFALLLAPTTAPAQTGLLDRKSAIFLSHTGTTAYVTLGVAMPLLRDGSGGGRRSLRMIDTLATTALFTQALKLFAREERPDGSGERNSFPSGHTSAAFAIATMHANFRPSEAAFWYLGALLIADSRLTLRRHRPRDVVAGALIGTSTAEWELRQPRGLVLTPFIRPQRGGVALGVGGSF